MYERAVGDCGEVGDCNRYCNRSFGLDVCLCFCCCVCRCICVFFSSTFSKTGQRSQSYTLTTTTSHVSSRFVRISEMILIKNFPQALEKIYKTTDWPPTHNGPAPSQSLRDSGKSRADLWAFAGLVTHTAHY